MHIYAGACVVTRGRERQGAKREEAMRLQKTCGFIEIYGGRDKGLPLRSAPRGAADGATRTRERTMIYIYIQLLYIYINVNRREARIRSAPRVAAALWRDQKGNYI